MSITTSDFALNPTLEQLVLEKLQQQSGFQAASKQVKLSPTGNIVGAIGASEAEWTGEGEKKPSKKNPVRQITILPNKMAKIVPWTDEAETAIQNLESILVDEALPSLALTFDKTVAGEKAAPTGFDSLTGLTASNVLSRKEFIKAVGSRGTDAGTNSIVLNVAMLDELDGLTTVNEQAVLRVVRENDFTGTINGTRYFVYKSELSTPKGFVGPFERKAYWGVLPGSVIVKRISGSFEDETGKTISLDQHNMKAMLVEGTFGFKLADKTLFNEITVTEAPAE